MKHKFSLMGRVAIALVLALSLSLVMAGPAAVMGQGASNYAEYTFETDISGTAVWSKEGTPPSGEYSAKLYDEGVVDEGAARVVIPGVNIPLAEIATLSYQFNYSAEALSPAEDQYAFPYMILAIDSGGGTEIDEWIVLHSGGDPYQPAEGEWVEWDLSAWDKWFDVGTEIEDFSSLAAAQAAYLDADVVDVKVAVGEGWAVGVTAYVDDIEINGVTYDLQPPIFMDDSYYQVGDTVTVTVIDPVANVNPAVQESVAVPANIDSPANNILLGLLETGVDTGVFTETFTLVGTTPGTGELLVTQGSIVKVTYVVPEDTDEVDSAAPVVAITAPTDTDFVAGAAVSITATVTETNPDTAVLTIGGVVIDEAVYDAETVTYTWDTTDETGEPLAAVWSDGAYTIEVSATDLAELVGSDSISVTVDNTDPVIADQEATPPVVEPAVENTIVFTASVTDDNVDTVTIDLSTIGGTSDVAMLDGGEDPDVAVDDGIYTAEITATIVDEAIYTLPVTATDLASNVATENITLVVSSDTVPPDITDLAITYEYGSSAQPGEPVTISANVTDLVGMGTVTATCAELTDTVTMNDDATAPDVTADDGIYTGEGTVNSDAGWGDYPVTITATDAKGNEAIDETLILAVRTGATGVPIVLVKGWNLISLPLIPVDADITVVISATTLDSGDVSSVGTVVGYDPATGDFPRYIPATGGALTEMEAGVGYWVFMEEADTLTVTGREWPVPPEVPPVYSVVEGWNLIGVKSIGPIAYEIYLGNLYDGEIPDFSVIWGYDAVAGRYFSVYPMIVEPSLFPGYGYWLWMKVDGTIVPPQ